jgi:hypothetical protein
MGSGGILLGAGWVVSAGGSAAAGGGGPQSCTASCQDSTGDRWAADCSGSTCTCTYNGKLPCTCTMTERSACLQRPSAAC